VRLAEPKMKDYQVHQKEGRWLGGKYAPMQRSLTVYSPTSIGLNTAGSTGRSSITADGPARVTSIE
jgi:hypothetical protein